VLRFAADHNVDGDILRGLRRRVPEIGIARAVDAGLSDASDPEVLDWAAADRRVLLTHDASTMVAFAYERLALGLPLWGVVVIGPGVSVGRAIEDLVTIAECSTIEEWDGQVVYLPL
jgi:hypothetical protein